MTLENLTSGSIKTAMKDAGAKSADLWMVPISDIREADGFNVRTENADRVARIAEIGEYILANGFMRDKPLSGFVAREDGRDIIYVVDGYTRLAGAHYAIERGAEIDVLPVITKPAGTNIEDLTVGLVVSNSGTPLTPIEKAAVCKRLVGYGMEEKVIAKRLGMTVGYVRDLLTLIAAPRDVRKLVEVGSVSASNATHAIKKHGEKAAAVINTGLDAAKAVGKNKATKATLAPKVDLLSKGIVYIKSVGGGQSLISMLAHLTDMDAGTIIDRMKEAA